MAKNILTIYYKNGSVNASLYEDGKDAVNVAALDNCKDAAEVITSKIDNIDCVVCPGGVLKSVKRGIYEIDENALRDIGKYGEHKYNCLMKLAAAVAEAKQVPAYMVDPMSCDELLARNRISSNSNVPKLSRYYALEHAAAIAAVAEKRGEIAEDRNYIVAYVDDLVSVGAHMRGFCIDVNDMLGLEGPMGFTASGDIPVAQIPKYMEKTGVSAVELKKTLTEESGLKGYTGACEPECADALTDPEDLRAVDTMVYQIAKWIGSSAMVLQGKVDAIVIAGKGAKSQKIVDGLITRVGKIADVEVAADLDVETFMAKAASVAGTFAWPVLKY